MKRGHTGAAVVLLIVLGTSPASAQSLCGSPNPPIADDQPRVKEKDFNAKSFARASQYLHEDFPKLLERLKTEDLLGTEAMYGYWNSLIKMEGYVLLQEALLRRADRDLVSRKPSGSSVTRAAVAAANERFEEAKRKFCTFLTKTHYMD